MNRNAFRVPSDIPQSRMPEYQRQQLTASPGADVSARLSSDAGAIIRQGADNEARQLDMLGKGMQQAAKAGYDLYTDYQTSKAKDAWLQYKQQAAGLKAELATLAGKDAIDPEKGVQARITKDMSEARTRITKDLGGMAAGLFERAASEVDSDLGNWGIGKAHGEAVNYGNATSEANISRLTNEALALAVNPEELRTRRSGIRDEVSAMAQRSGYGDEWINAKAEEIDRKILTQAISDRIRGEQLGEATSLIRTYGPVLGGALPGLKAAASAQGRAMNARARAEAAQARQKSVDTFIDGTRDIPAAERLGMLKEKFGKDQKLYRAGLDALTFDEGARQDIKNKEQAVRLSDYAGALEAASKISDPARSWQEITRIVNNAAPEDRTTVIKYANNMRMAEGYGQVGNIQDDPLAVMEATNRLAAGETVHLKADYGDRLSPKMIVKLSNEAFSKALPSIKTAFDVAGSMWTGANNVDAKNILGRANVDLLWKRFLDQTDADEKKDPVRLRAEADAFFKQVTLEYGFWGQEKTTIAGVQGYYLDSLSNARPVRETPEYKEAVATLQREGVMPDGIVDYTSEQISNAHKKIVQRRSAEREVE